MNKLISIITMMSVTLVCHASDAIIFNNVSIISADNNKEVYFPLTSSNDQSVLKKMFNSLKEKNCGNSSFFKPSTKSINDGLNVDSETSYLCELDNHKLSLSCSQYIYLRKTLYSCMLVLNNLYSEDDFASLFTTYIKFNTPTMSENVFLKLKNYNRSPRVYKKSLSKDEYLWHKTNMKNLGSGHFVKSLVQTKKSNITATLITTKQQSILKIKSPELLSIYRSLPKQTQSLTFIDNLEREYTAVAHNNYDLECYKDANFVSGAQYECSIIFESLY